MSTFDIAEAKAHFSELVQKAMLGEEVVIAKDNKPVLKLVLLEHPQHPQHPQQRRKPGSGNGQILHIAADFDATPAAFKDYV